MEDEIPRKSRSAFRQVATSIRSASQGALNSSDTEADMSDSVVDYTIRKQCSSSVLQLKTHRLGLSASHPNLVAKDDLDSLRLRTPTPPSTPPIGLDITENEKDKYLTLEPTDLTNFRKWIVGFCIVNFDLEIGQGKKLILVKKTLLINFLLTPPLIFFIKNLALDYAYPPMDLTAIEQKNM